MNIKPNSSAGLVIGLDLGGTNVRAAVIDADEKILGRANNPSFAKLGAAACIGQVVLTIQEAISDANVTAQDVAAVGMAVPGHIDTANGNIIWSPNFGETVDAAFKCFTDVVFCGPISEATGIACYAGNDANIAALGEFRYGAGREVQDMVMFTLGTGIGSGVISGGQLIIGVTGAAVEMGHHVISADLGSAGTLEALCGQKGIADRAEAIYGPERYAELLSAVGGDEQHLPAKIDEEARAGGAEALAVFERTGYYVGIGITNAINIFNPSMVVIGGGIRKATGLIESARRTAEQLSIASMWRDVQIVEAELGGDAGVMGAAELAWRMAAY